MENVIQTAPQTVIPALYKAAAVSVIALSVAGIGVMTGYLPVKKSDTPQNVMGTAQPAFAAPGVPGVNGMPAVAVPAAPAPATPVAVQPATGVAQTPAVERLPAPRPRVIRTTSRSVDEPYGRQPYGRASPISTHPVDVSAAQPYPPTYPVAQASTPAKAACTSCGTIESIREVEKPGEGSGLGMAGGALGGAVLGKQFGNGRGRDALTILGAIGGGFAGHQAEKSYRTVKSYEVMVRMEDGSLRSIPSTTQPNWRAGDRVKVEGGSISLNYS